MAVGLDKISAVKNQYEKEWLSFHGVVGVGIGFTISNQVGVIITVLSDTQIFRDMFKKEIDGIQIEVQGGEEINVLNGF